MIEPVLRAADGQFLEGVSGNPAGRPVGTRSKLVILKERLEIAVREGVDPAQIGRIVAKIAGQAEKGDVKSAALIFNTFLSRASVADESEVDRGGHGITIRIENATFKAQQTPPIVDAEFKEIVNGK